MMIWESTVFEKLFQEDQPMGGGATGMGFSALSACISSDSHKIIPVIARRSTSAHGTALRSCNFRIRTPRGRVTVQPAAPNTREFPFCSKLTKLSVEFAWDLVTQQ